VAVKGIARGELVVTAPMSCQMQVPSVTVPPLVGNAGAVPPLSQVYGGFWLLTVCW
jgi:hypothetical protein